MTSNVMFENLDFSKKIFDFARDRTRVYRMLVSSADHSAILLCFFRKNRGFIT